MEKALVQLKFITVKFNIYLTAIFVEISKNYVCDRIKLRLYESPLVCITIITLCDMRTWRPKYIKLWTRNEFHICKLLFFSVTFFCILAWAHLNSISPSLVLVFVHLIHEYCISFISSLISSNKFVYDFYT